tara:strand:+ start:511 stop:1212 length:702 start_codon:yes stop_codon:yes gene_type:complete
MAIIDNHKSVKIDKSFEDKHPEMFKFFNDRNIDVEVSDDFIGLKTFLTSLPKEDYPYNYDEFFDPDKSLTLGTKSFVLYLKKDGNIISTYAAKDMDFTNFYNEFNVYWGVKSSEEKVKELSFLFTPGDHMYSSCQWVSKDHRGKKFGMILDHLKKNICFDIFNATSNYAIHKESLKDYHLNGLHYNESIHLATIPQGDVGGAGDKNDKIYNVCWIEKDAWLNKLNDVRKLYNR